MAGTNCLTGLKAIACAVANVSVMKVAHVIDQTYLTLMETPWTAEKSSNLDTLSNVRGMVSDCRHLPFSYFLGRNNES